MLRKHEKNVAVFKALVKILCSTPVWSRFFCRGEEQGRAHVGEADRAASKADPKPLKP